MMFLGKTLCETSIAGDYEGTIYRKSNPDSYYLSILVWINDFPTKVDPVNLDCHSYLTGLSEEQSHIRAHNIIMLQAHSSGINYIVLLR